MVGFRAHIEHTNHLRNNSEQYMFYTITYYFVGRVTTPVWTHLSNISVRQPIDISTADISDNILISD